MQCNASASLMYSVFASTRLSFGEMHLTPKQYYILIYMRAKDYCMHATRLHSMQ